MKIQAPCAVCIEANPSVLTISDGVVSDSGLVHVTCPKGHKSAILFKERKYMTLLKSGTSALLDAHVRESVSSISVALERCYEFFLRSALHKQGLESDVTEKTWKLMSKQSERQFGAFCVVYAIESGTAFELPQEIQTFRNRVIHQGYIPTDVEVLEFGRAVMLVIRGIERLLEKMGGQHSDFVQAQSIANQTSEIPCGLTYATLDVTGVRVGDGNQVVGVVETFDDLIHLQSRRWGQAPGA